MRVPPGRTVPAPSRLSLHLAIRLSLHPVLYSLNLSLHPVLYFLNCPCTLYSTSCTLLPIHAPCTLPCTLVLRDCYVLIEPLPAHMPRVGWKTSGCSTDPAPCIILNHRNESASTP